MDFVLITILMFVFIFIYTLLGRQIFQGKYNFGPDEELSAMVNEFKEQVLGFLKDIFSFHSADFKSVESLSLSVMSLARARLDTVKRKLGCDSDSTGDS